MNRRTGRRCNAMQAVGKEPNENMYKSLLLACRKSPSQDAWVHALRFLDAMVARGFPVCTEDYNLALYVLVNCFRVKASPPALPPNASSELADRWRAPCGTLRVRCMEHPSVVLWYH